MSKRHIENRLHKKNGGVEGVCCRCGYDKVPETDCPKDEDGHCQHWWDGDPDVDGPTIPHPPKGA